MNHAFWLSADFFKIDYFERFFQITKVLNSLDQDQPIIVFRTIFNTRQQSEGQPNPQPQNPMTLKCDLDSEFA